MMAIEKKPKVKHGKYDFFFLRRESGWGDVPDWNEGKAVRNSIGAPIAEDKKTTHYFHYFVREDVKARPSQNSWRKQ